MLAWLPTYFTDTMNLTISQAAQFSLLPPMAALAASAVAGPLADSLIAKDWDVGVVRKTAQCVAFLGPVACLGGASLTQNSYMPLGMAPSDHELVSRCSVMQSSCMLCGMACKECAYLLVACLQAWGSFCKLCMIGLSQGQQCTGTGLRCSTGRCHAGACLCTVQGLGRQQLLSAVCPVILIFITA